MHITSFVRPFTRRPRPVDSFSLAIPALIMALSSHPVDAQESGGRLLVFGTPTVGTGDLGSWPEAGGEVGIDAGDAICRHWAGAASLDNPDLFIAALSDANSDFACRMRGLAGTLANNCDVVGELPVTGPWHRVDGKRWGQPLVLGSTGLELRLLRRPLALDVFGDILSEDLVYTGSNPDGVVENSCANWTSADQGSSGTIGRAFDTYVNWLWNNAPWPCSDELALMCLEVGTAAALPPEPVRGRIAFNTAARGNGDFTTWPEADPNTTDPLEAADSICQAEAMTAGLDQPESFRAWLSTPTVDAIDRLTNDGTWRRPDNVIIAESKTKLLGRLLETNIRLNAQGVPAVPGVRTGTMANGRAAAQTCSGWTSTAGTGLLGRGDSARTWTSFNSQSCGSVAYSIYCFSDAIDHDFIFASGLESGTIDTWAP